MKLKQIEEIAKKPVPVWQPVLLIILLLLGIIVVPLITKNAPRSAQKNTSLESMLNINTLKEKLGIGVKTVLKPLSMQLQKEAGVTLGIAGQAVQQTAEEIATRSASQAKEFVLDNTLGKALQNFKSLSTDQQELIKKAICK